MEKIPESTHTWAVNDSIVHHPAFQGDTHFYEMDSVWNSSIQPALNARRFNDRTVSNFKNG